MNSSPSIAQLIVIKLQVVTSQKNVPLILTLVPIVGDFSTLFLEGYEKWRNVTDNSCFTRHFAVTFPVITGLFNYLNPNSCSHVSIGNKSNIPNVPYLHKSHYTDRFGGSSHNNADDDMKI